MKTAHGQIQHSHGRRRAIGQNLAMALVSILVTALVCEGLIRLLPPEVVPVLLAMQPKQIELGDIFQPSPNPRLYYVPTPGVYDVNAAGYRGPQYPEQKPHGVKRIVGVGNSTQFGMGVSEKDTYLRRLESMLDASETPVEVVNLAVGGYNTQQELEMLRTRGFEFEPDLVILGYDHNDPKPILGHVRPPMPPEYGENLVRSELIRYLRRKFYSTPRLRFGGRVDGYPTRGGDWDDHVAALIEIARLCRERGIPMMVVIYDAWCRRENIDDSRHYRSLHKPLHPLWREQGYHVVDCYELFQDYMREQDWEDTKPLWVSVEPRDGHPNPRGHQLIAEAVVQRMSQEGLLQ